MRRWMILTIVLTLTLPAQASFRGYLKQSTAVTLKFGPIVDATDGYSPETGLTLHAAHIRLSKNGGDFASKNSTTAQIHDEYGYYDVALNATDTGTLGILTVGWTDANSVVIVPQEYAVIHPNEYDRMFDTGPMGSADIRDAVFDGTITGTPYTFEQLLAAIWTKLKNLWKVGT